jgi:hypothetical protein
MSAATAPRLARNPNVRVALHALHDYMTMFGHSHASAPSGDWVARLLEEVPWPDLNRLLLNLRARRERPGAGYTWFLEQARQHPELCRQAPEDE